MELGDVMKFGRVRFRVKNLVTEMMHNGEANITKTEMLRSPVPTNLGAKTGLHFSISSNLNRVGGSGPVRLISEADYNGQDTQVLATLQSSRFHASMNVGMYEIIRMHSSANFSFDLNNQKGTPFNFDPIEAH